MNQAVKVAHRLIAIGQDRVVDRGALGFVDVGDPALVAFSRIHTQGQGFDIALLPFGPQLGHLAQLGSADRREIGGVGKQHHPAIASEVVEVDGAQLGVLGEIGNGIAEKQGHVGDQLKKAILKPTTTGRGVFDHIGPARCGMGKSAQRWPSNSSQVIGPLDLTAKGFAAREQLGKLGLVELAKA